jgi:hypothetical protein
MQLVVVAQRRDCDGNLAFAGAFAHPRLHQQVVVRQLLIEGRARDTVGLRQRLPRLLQRVPMALLDERERSALQAFGHRATPLFLLLDSESRLLATIPIHPDPVRRTAFMRAVAHLVNVDPHS